METYYYADIGDLDPSGVGVEDGQQFISNYSINTSFNILENIPLGMYASRMVVHDIVQKEVYNVDYNYSESYNKHKHADPDRNMGIGWESDINTTVYDSQENNMVIHRDVDEYTTSPKSFQRIITKHSHLYDNYSNDYLEFTIQNRISQMEQLNNFVLEFTVPGDFRRNIGDVVYITIPSVDSNRLEDKLHSGRYIILSLRHKIDMERHTMLIIAAKDTYFTPLPA
mgnify:CR=1 FL=1